jgi:hypothetical protein
MSHVAGFRGAAVDSDLSREQAGAEDGSIGIISASAKTLSSPLG